MRPEDLHLYPDVAVAIRNARALGFLAVLVSNQPGVAKGKYSREAFEAINRRLEVLLREAGTTLDGTFYCLHHPRATLTEYRKDCRCRKPKPGMILDAADRFTIDLHNSYLIGDTAIDVATAEAAGCVPVLLARDHTRRENAPAACTPAAVVAGLDEALKYIVRETALNVA
jgi:D-glycero-D-manno-heptose 1,7-bisphosphate phosphatase